MNVNGRGVTCLLASCAVLCLGATPGGGACPRRCACYVPTEVHCTFRYLTSIPDGIPPSVERINLGYNSLVRLTGTDFSGLTRLELLMLHSNGIDTVPAKTFSDLQALQVLKMSYNKVRELQKDAFHGLRSLTRLHMDHNNVEFINPEVFHGLTSLRLVHLEGNRLTKLHPDTFVAVRYLQVFKASFIKYLYLSENLLSTLPQELVSCMPNLESLYLHGNPWTCDCHLKWLSDWIQAKPDILKCKKDRSASGPPQCPLCTNPRTSRGEPLAAVPAAAFLCAKPTIDPALKPKNLTVLEDGASVPLSPRDFLAPLGSLVLNVTDESRREAHVACSIRRPSRVSPLAFTEGKDDIVLRTSLSAVLVCDIDPSDIQPVWQILALYSDAPLVLQRGPTLADAPQLCYSYSQAAPKPDALFTGVQAALRAEPAWLLQDQVSLQLTRTATTLSTLHIRYASDARITVPRAETGPARPKWTMISRDNHAKLEHTVLVGGTLSLDCPGHGDPPPRVEWLLADGRRVRAPHGSEDGRTLVDGSGRLALQRADRSDTGLYHCVCANDDDADVLTYRVTVLEPAADPRREHGAEHSVPAGATLSLPCPSTGVPDASVSWVLPGNTVLSQSSGGRQVLTNGTLRILHVAPEDQGLYRCVAANPSGVDFLINRVLVKPEGPTPGEPIVEAEGSGLDEPGPTVHVKGPPAAQLPTSGPGGGGAEKRVSSTGKKHGYREVLHRRRGDSTARRFREHRRLFPPSARRIDPQHWAALVEKARKNTVSEKRASATARPPPLVTQLLKIPAEEADSSGMLPADEDFIVLATQVPSVLARTVTVTSRKTSESPVSTMSAGAEVSPVVSPQTLPTTTDAAAAAKNLDTPSTVEGTNDHHVATILPLLPETTQLQEANEVGRRRQHLQSASPVTAMGTVVNHVYTKTLSTANSTANLFLASESATKGPQTSATGGSEPRSNRFYSHFPQKLDTPGLPSGPHTAAHAQVQLQIPRNSTTNAPLSRRFGRWRKIWGRGRIVSPHKTPALRRQRYGLVRPTAKGSSKARTIVLPATELEAGCPSCAPRLGPTTAAAASSPPSSSPLPLPTADMAGVTEAPATPVHSPSLLSDNRVDGESEKTPTVNYFSAARTQVTPVGTSVTHAPTPASAENTHTTDTGYPGVSKTHEAERDSGIILPLLGPATKPSVPTPAATTRFSGGKIPWHEMSVNNHIQVERSKDQHKSGSQRSTATGLPEIPPALPSDKVSAFPLAMHPANVVPIPTTTMATTRPGTPDTHRPVSLPTVGELPFPPISPTLPGTPNKESSAHFLSMQIAMLTTPPTAPASTVSNKTQIARRVQSKEGSQETRKDPGSSASGLATATAVTLPVLMAAEMSSKPSTSAFTHTPPENIKGVSSRAELHPRTPHWTEVTAEPPQGSPPTFRSPTTLETALSSKLHQGTTARSTTLRHTTAPLFLSSRDTPVPIPAPSAWSHQSAAADTVATTPVSQVMTTTMNKPRAPSRHSADPQQSAVEAAASPSFHPNAKFTAGAASFVYSSLFQSTPMPELVTVKPLNSKLRPSLWSENLLWHESHPEIASKGRKPGVSTLPTLGMPEDTTHSSNWEIHQTAKTGGSDETPVQKATTSELPSDPLSRDVFARPRIVGGNAASFTVPANLDAFLPCQAVGNPLPTIHWTRVSSGLDLSKRKQDSRFRVLSNGTLSIQRVDIQDRGQYLCSAANPFGTARLHVTLSVVSYPPRILEGRTREIMVHSGSSVELRCSAEGLPSPTISWILANQTVVSHASKGNRQALVTSDGTLVIHNVSVYNRGFYKCVARNSAGQDSLLVKMQVIAAPPVIVEPKRQVVAGSWGASLKLPCTAQGTPQPSVHWVLPDGAEVRPLQFTDSKLFLSPNGTLYVRNVASSDQGTYECIATSSTGSERRVVIITVEERESIPRIDFASQTWHEVNLGDQLLLNCTATGEPKPHMMWRLPSKAVVDQWHRMGSRIHVYPNGSLFIGSVTEKDGGDYLCVARNKVGDDLTLMHVSLSLKPAKIDHKQQFKKQVLHGKDFQVDCKASGSPVPQISWSLPDGTMVNHAVQADERGRRTRRYTLFNNGTLYFNKAGIAEEGDYTCYAQNTLGKDEMKVHLTVVTAAPRIRTGHKAHPRVKAGDTAVLDCEVVGEPKPKIFWLLPSNDMISFSKGRYAFHANGSLSINKVKLLDAGEYVCVARNPRGDDTKMYKLDVVPRPPRINGLYTNKTVIKATAVRHSKKHLDCRAEGTPPPQIMWIMPDNVFLTAPYYGSRVTVHPNGTLEIRNVRLSDSADLTCVARSDGGESVLVVRLEVLEMLRRPTFRNPLNEKIIAQPGKPTALNCSVDGNPPPEIIWILPNGTRFPGGPQRGQYLIASNGSFIIYKTTRDDTGKYRCAARNKVGYIEKLIVLELGRKPVILTYASGAVYGLSGEPLSLHCVSDGSPKPHTKWTVPSGYVLSRPHISAKYVLHENGTLVIKAAATSDRGNYICKAENSMGHALITVPVTVVAYPPRIIHRPPSSVLAQTGAALQLHCVALGVPKPELTWTMSDRLLPLMAGSESTRGLEPFHPQGTLVIQNPQISDSGMYTCTAKNLLGKDSATTYLQVI